MSLPEEDEYRSSEDEDYMPSDDASEHGSEQSEHEDDEDAAPEEGGESSGKKAKNGRKKKTTSKGRNAYEEKGSNSVVPSQSAVDVDAIFAELIGEDKPKEKSKILDEQSNRSKPMENEAPSTSTVEVAKTAKVTEVFDFAGDEIRIEREVTEEEKSRIEEREKKREATKEKPQKRMGITGALTMLTKKPRMSVLEKSNHDWTSFKKEENIEEELTTFNKGKQGYLNKVEFLSRADAREYEKEKAQRNARRN